MERFEKDSRKYEAKLNATRKEINKDTVSPITLRQRAEICRFSFFQVTAATARTRREDFSLLIPSFQGEKLVPYQRGLRSQRSASCSAPFYFHSINLVFIPLKLCRGTAGTVINRFNRTLAGRTFSSFGSKPGENI